MRELQLKAELNQSGTNDLILRQFKNDLGTIPNSKADRVSKGKYNLFIQDGFKDTELVFCPQNKTAFNTVGMAENTFVLYGNKINDSNYEINIMDLNLNPWEDSLGQVPFELYVYKNDFVPVEA